MRRWGICGYLPDGSLDYLDAPRGSSNKTAAVEIRGHSIGKMFDRWFAFYDDVRSPITPDLIGKLCIVGIDDGRIMIKKVERGKSELFNLHSNDPKQTIENVKLEWAARVIAISPK